MLDGELAKWGHMARLVTCLGEFDQKEVSGFRDYD